MGLRRSPRPTKCHSGGPRVPNGTPSDWFLSKTPLFRHQLVARLEGHQMARPRKSAQVRFQAEVRESDYLAPGMATPCQEWLGATNAKDDPVFWFDHRTVRAQRVALSITV